MVWVVGLAGVASAVTFGVTEDDPLSVAEAAGGSPWWSAAAGILAIGAVFLFLAVETRNHQHRSPTWETALAALFGIGSVALSALSVGAQVDTGWSAGPYWVMLAALVVFGFIAYALSNR